MYVITSPGCTTEPDGGSLDLLLVQVVCSFVAVQTMVPPGSTTKSSGFDSTFPEAHVKLVST